MPKLVGGHKIPVAKLQGTLNAMVEQVGFRETALRIDCSRSSLLYWLHLSEPTHHGKPAKHVFESTAIRILQARVVLNQDVREGRVTPLTNGYRARSRRRAGICVGCGAELGNCTEGCKTCWDRQRRRGERLAA